jgi:proteasome accessory factor B
VAQNVAEVAWHRTQHVDVLPNGAIEFHADVSGFNEIVWWILGYGDQAEVLAPEKLRRLVAQRARNMHELYQKSGASHATGRRGDGRVQLHI